MSRLLISFLHISSEAAAFDKKLALIEKGIHVAATQGSSLVICPELCLTGYGFHHTVGLEWITSQPDVWMSSLCVLAKKFHVAVVLSHPERDCSGAVYNSAFFISELGKLLGCHRKVNVRSDQWSHPGQCGQVFLWNGIRVGMMICADAYTSDVARLLEERGAEIFLSPAAWGPGLYGPAGEWEQRTLETGLPLLVCNRTGEEDSLSFEKAESLVVKGGKKLLSHSSAASTILTVDWDWESMVPTQFQFSTHTL